MQRVLKDWEEKLLCENSELKQRVYKLVSFLFSSKSKDVDDKHIKLMIQQLYGMYCYGNALYARLKDLDLIPETYYEDRIKNSFEEALLALKAGFCVKRLSWTNKKFVCKQVPSEIGLNIIPNMQSLPKDAKSVILKYNKGISYRDQLLLVYMDNIADSYIPSTEDLFANDWIIINPEEK